MKPQAIVSALMAMSLSLGGPAFGQAEGSQEDRDKTFQQIQRYNQRQAQRHGQHGYYQEPHGYAPQYRLGGPRGDGRGAGPDHRYYRGDRLPPDYRRHNYVVEDWRGHGLSAPPHGYHWLQSGGDYLLVAIATGVILYALLSN